MPSSSQSGGKSKIDLPAVLQRLRARFGIERLPARRLALMSIEKRTGGIVWLRYKIRR